MSGYIGNLPGGFRADDLPLTADRLAEIAEDRGKEPNIGEGRRMAKQVRRMAKHNMQLRAMLKGEMQARMDLQGALAGDALRGAPTPIVVDKAAINQPDRLASLEAEHRARLDAHSERITSLERAAAVKATISANVAPAPAVFTREISGCHRCPWYVVSGPTEGGAVRARCSSRNVPELPPHGELRDEVIRTGTPPDWCHLRMGAERLELVK